jgi:hypothetical protein
MRKPERTGERGRPRGERWSAESARRPRGAEAARAMAEQEEDQLLDELTPTEFDSEEWTW